MYVIAILIGLAGLIILSVIYQPLLIPMISLSVASGFTGCFGVWALYDIGFERYSDFVIALHILASMFCYGVFFLLLILTLLS